MTADLFHGWFTFATALFGATTGYCMFTLKRWDVVFALFLVWLCLASFEYWLQNREFESWKRRVFQ